MKDKEIYKMITDINDKVNQLVDEMEYCRIIDIDDFMFKLETHNLLNDDLKEFIDRYIDGRI